MGTDPPDTSAALVLGRRLERSLARGGLTFSGAYIAVNEMRQFIEQYPEAVGPRTLAPLAALLKSRDYGRQSRRLFLYRAVARALRAAALGTTDGELARQALEILQQTLAGRSGSRHRAAAETLGSLPVTVEQPAAMPCFEFQVPRCRWETFLARHGITDIGEIRFYGRSLVAGTNGSRRLCIVKLGSGEAARQALEQEARWMLRLRRRQREFTDFFAIPKPLPAGEGFVFSPSKDTLPLKVPAGLAGGGALYAAGFLAHADYYRYPNARRPEMQLSKDRFRETMFRNARLFGVLTGWGIIHTAPIPLFHNRIQTRRRSDRGLYEWPRGGRLDRWLSSCRFPNFGLSGVRDFEHLAAYSGNPKTLYFHIGCHLLGLMLVTGSYFRHKSPEINGLSTDGTPRDARFLFDRELMVEMLRGLLHNYYRGFVGADLQQTPALDFEHLAERMIQEMGVDRYMEEILRVADQQAMTESEFREFLAAPGGCSSGTPESAQRRKGHCTLQRAPSGGIQRTDFHTGADPFPRNRGCALHGRPVPAGCRMLDNMLWLLLALLTAFAVASHDAWVKRFFAHMSAYEMSAVPMAYALPMIVLALLWTPVPPLDTTFYWTFSLSLPLNGVSFLLYMLAIKISPLSLTLPYLAFTPTFIILTGFLFLGEMPNSWGISGILTTCVGCYVLNLEAGGQGIWGPLKAIARETGSWVMLCVAVLFSLAAVIGKKAILHSSPQFFSLAFFALHNLLLLFLLFGCKKIRPSILWQRPLPGAVAGVLFFAHILLHGYAIELTKAAYMIAVKRLSILVGMVYGTFWFGEKNFVRRISGAALMLSGAVMIMLKGR